MIRSGSEQHNAKNNARYSTLSANLPRYLSSFPGFLSFPNSRNVTHMPFADDRVSDSSRVSSLSLSRFLALSLISHVFPTVACVGERLNLSPCVTVSGISLSLTPHAFSLLVHWFQLVGSLSPLCSGFSVGLRADVQRPLFFRF